MGSRGKDPVDIASRIVALQRRNNTPSRRDKSQAESSRAGLSSTPQPESARAASSSLPHAESSRAAVAGSVSPKSPSPRIAVASSSHADPPHAPVDEFSRRLKISSSPRTSQRKLYTPDASPMRVVQEPEPMVSSSRDTTSNTRRDAMTPRQLFDHRKDDPVRFSVLARPGKPPVPTPKSSLEYGASSASASSYAHSVSSSSFTLSSTTDGSSASSALFEDGRRQGESSDPGNTAFALQLKRLYRGITSLEKEILEENADDANEDAGRILINRKSSPASSEAKEYTQEQEKWRKLVDNHKRLVEMMHDLLQISLAPTVPASLRNIPTKYNIIIRMWTHGFHKLLESLRRAAFSGSEIALEHLQDFIYYSYVFYTHLHEEHTLRAFRSGWLEALGDLARYRMAVAALVTGTTATSQALTAAALGAPADPSAAKAKSSSVNSFPVARIDDSPSPSVGVAAARQMNVEPEKERWRVAARGWYAAGLADTPGTGKLHHHLGLLSRDADGEELRAVYHFVKSMTALHPFSTARESVLPIWTPAVQARRWQPDARASELFVLMHGLLFTNVQLDDFARAEARFLERLSIDGAEEREWAMMAIINIGATLEYGRPTGMLRKAGLFGGGSGTTSAPNGSGAAMAVKLARRPDDTSSSSGRKMDVDDATSSPLLSSEHATTIAMDDIPLALRFSLRLTFSILEYVLRHPTRRTSRFARSSVNPYLTVLLTFLATILRHTPARALLERFVPWNALATFFASSSGAVPRSIVSSEFPISGAEPAWPMLTSGCAPPLNEDWCMRGMEWVGRKVFERGYWKSGEERMAELEVLEMAEGGAEMETDGVIEEDGEDGEGREKEKVRVRAWVRVVRCGAVIVNTIDGFNSVNGREWKVEGALRAKVNQWEEEEQLEREAEERRRRGTRWAADDEDDSAMEVDEDDDEDDASDEEDSEEVKALKARRRYLKSLLVNHEHVAPSSRPRRRVTAGSKLTMSHPSLHIVPGYTVLVLDTNILLSSLSIITSLITSHSWTIVVPLPVITELDGLGSEANVSPLADAARAALEYLSTHIRSHSSSLKILTSRGNYLPNLNVRSEQVELRNGSNNRNMDDLILRSAIWQDEHWMDRTPFLKGAQLDGQSTEDRERQVEGAAKVVLLTLDRNLRLKARSRQLPAANEKDMAAIFATVS